MTCKARDAVSADSPGAPSRAARCAGSSPSRGSPSGSPRCSRSRSRSRPRARLTRRCFRARPGTLRSRSSRTGGGGYEPQLFDWLADVEGVGEVLPVVQSPAALVGRTGPLFVYVLGIAGERDADARLLELSAGRALGTRDEVWLEEAFARAQGWEIDSDVVLVTPDGAVNLRIAGLLRPRGAALFNAGSAVFLPLAVAQRLFHLEERVNSLQIVPAKGADPAKLEARISQRLPAGFVVQPPAARAAFGTKIFLGANQGLLVLSLVSLVGSAFIILNTFLMSFSERRRQFALLRALGTTRSQLRRWLFAEAFWYGVAGSVLGLAAGAALARGMTIAMEKALGAELPDPVWQLSTFAISLVAGVAVTLAAAIAPIHLANRRDPLTGLRDATGHTLRALPRWPLRAALLLAAPMLVIQAGYIGDWFPREAHGLLLGPGTALTLICLVLLIPALFPALLKLSGAAYGRVLGTAGRLGLRNLARRPIRTALTMATLLCAIATAIGMGNSVMDNTDDILEWFDRTLVGDYFLRPVMPERANLSAPVLPERCAGDVLGMRDVAHVERVSFLRSRTADGEPVLVIARDYGGKRPFAIDLQEGDPEEVIAALSRGECVAGTTLARRLDLHPGRAITVEGVEGSRALRVAGTATEYTVGGNAITMNWRHASELLGNREVHVLVIGALPGREAALGAALRSYAKEQRLVLQDRGEFRTLIGEIVQLVTGSFWVMIALVFVVASLGIVNTLTMNVLDAQREIAVLRAVAMTRADVRRLVLAEATHLATMSLVPGVLAGCILAWLINLATEPLSGFPIEFDLHWGCVAGCFAAAAVVTLASAFLPARHAAHLKIIEGLRYE